MEVRLRGLLRALQLSGLPQLIDRLRRNGTPELWDTVTGRLANHETQFFRDAPVFAALVKTVLPELVKRKHQVPYLNIWCAGCSTGQEAYSIAMTLHRHVPNLERWLVRIQATDVCPAVLDHARRGIYSDAELRRGVPPAQRERYFRCTPTGWRVAPEIARMIEWRSLNLLGDWAGLPHFDIVFMRHVLVYFSPAARRQVLTRLPDQLRTGGYLFLGHADLPLPVATALQPVTPGEAPCYRLEQGPRECILTTRS
jgi:chemotaxis protein methyltransferase CheR